MVWGTPHFFWIFVISVIIVVSVQRVIRSYQREKTIRAAIEKGVSLDPATLHSLQASAPSPQDSRNGLLTGAIVTFFVGCGLAVMGYFISLNGDGRVLHAMAGVGGLMWCISLGLLVAHFAVRPRDK